MSVQISDLLKIAIGALRDAGIECSTDTVHLTSFEKEGLHWRVTITYRKDRNFNDSNAALLIGESTGEVKGFWEGKTWK